MRLVFLISAGFVLAGCGADGEPVQPSMSANVGVGSSGTYVGGGVGLRRGGLGVYLGI
ncbi:argininosuccinate lyase [Ruegeria atlantica]|uniref:argininosuccinate lyase n=1 Tax=Ruegeria atlantica TaxID=81569 RepID=UPI003F68B92B